MNSSRHPDETVLPPQRMKKTVFRGLLLLSAIMTLELGLRMIHRFHPPRPNVRDRPALVFS